MIDPITLAQSLIRCPSVTPKDAGCLDLIAGMLTEMGFTCHRLPFENVDNLYARLGTEGQNFCFAGHTDVVPVVDETQWTHDPFGGIISDGVLYGRGAVDMKGAIASYISAISSFLDQDPPPPYSLSFLLTSDEEGPAVHGTRRVIEWLKTQGETIDFCLVGEPTSKNALGDMVKVGRRGSLNVGVEVIGIAGHVAYPQNAVNPVSLLLDYLHRVRAHTLDEGTERFDPSNLEVTSLDVGNTATNVIPNRATAHFNIRFNDKHTAETLIEWLQSTAQDMSSRISIKTHVTGEAFFCPDEGLKGRIGRAVESVTGQQPHFSTSGGTSDARFIKDICPVIECGLLNKTAHHIDEHVPVKDLADLAAIYLAILSGK